MKSDRALVKISKVKLVEVIRNMEPLAANASKSTDRLARSLALRALDAAVQAADPSGVIMENVKLDGSRLIVSHETYDLSQVKNIYVVGAGKASGQMALALEKTLDDRITQGCVNILRGTSSRYRTQRIELNEASHPLSDQAGVRGAEKMIQLAENARKDDLLICLISGGGSALLPLPRKGLSLSEKQTITKSLLRAGANINELNSVRKHLSDIKGGWLAKKVGGASIITLILSDVVGDPVDVIASGPTAPDQSSFNDAISVLKKYKLWERTPKKIRKILIDGKAARIPETPKAEDETFSRVKHFILFNNRQACEAAAAYLKRTRLTTSILSTTMEGEANQVGKVLGSIAREMAVWNRPFAKPSAFIIGGETTVTVHGKGTGGRNQEVALSAAFPISSADGIVIASMGTDGIDGPTDAAGAIVDGSTITRAKALQMSAEKFLVENDSYNFFLKLGDLILTGPTGTNVNDVAITVALDERSISAIEPA